MRHLRACSRDSLHCCNICIVCSVINYMAVTVLCLFLMMPWVGVQFVIVAFLGLTHFLSAHTVKPV